MKKIVINSCSACPHKDHKGGFGQVSYVPVCRKVNRELPYTVGVSLKVVTASMTGDIPDWCPLEDN